MKIREFIERISKEDFNLDILLEIKKYIPIMEKKKFAMDVIAACTDDVDGFVTADRFKMNIYFNMMVLGLYTNLEIDSDFDEMVREYDLLCENGMLNNLLANCTIFKTRLILDSYPQVFINTASTPLYFFKSTFSLPFITLSPE